METAGVDAGYSPAPLIIKITQSLPPGSIQTDGSDDHPKKKKNVLELSINDRGTFVYLCPLIKLLSHTYPKSPTTCEPHPCSVEILAAFSPHLSVTWPRARSKTSGARQL